MLNIFGLFAISISFSVRCLSMFFAHSNWIAYHRQGLRVLYIFQTLDFVKVAVCKYFLSHFVTCLLIIIHWAFTEQVFFILMKSSYHFLFYGSAKTISWSPKNTCQKLKSQIVAHICVCVCVCSRSVIALGFTFNSNSMMHFKLIFIQGVRHTLRSASPVKLSKLIDFLRGVFKWHFEFS